MIEAEVSVSLFWWWWEYYSVCYTPLSLVSLKAPNCQKDEGRDLKRVFQSGVIIFIKWQNIYIFVFERLRSDVPA